MNLTTLHGGYVDRNPNDVVDFQIAARFYPEWSHRFTWTQIGREWSYNHALRYLEYAERARRET